MARNIRVLATITAVAFVLLLGYLTYWQVVMAAELSSMMPYNAARLQAEEARILRGSILDRNGESLAWTEPSAEGNARVYAEPSLAHVTGYHSYRYGTSNIESSFDRFLRAEQGVDPLTLLRKDSLHQAVEGADVRTTIDLRLQRVAVEALGDSRGAIVALNPRTGEILALASNPYFDPNTIDEGWETIADDPSAPLLNRATAGQYVPGSTFKTVTLAAALDEGVVNPQTTFTNDGDLIIDGFRIQYTNPPNKRTFDLTDAFAFSINAAFAEIGLRLGAPALVDGAANFGFGEAPPLDGIPTEPSTISQSPDYLDGKPALASTAFGQGQLSVTPLQMALVAAAVANDGVVPTPYVVAEVTSQSGQTLYRAEPRAWRQAMTPATAEIVNEMMIASVERGYAAPAKIQGVTVGGKTGTAEVTTGAEPHAWFIGYAPADDPQIAIAVIRENAGAGSSAATPQGQRVMAAWLEMR